MPKIELYPHNQAALNHLEEALKYTRRAAVIQPTGTGKSFVALAFIERRPNNSFLYLAPSTHIFNQLKHHAGHTDVLLHTTMMTYQKLCLLHEDELGKLEPDYIILDEFHRCGADDWGSAVDHLLALYVECFLIGFTATPVRYLDKAGTRDMSEELFHGSIASYYTLQDAINDKVLPVPHYVLGDILMNERVSSLETALTQVASYGRARTAGYSLLESLKRNMAEAQGIDEIFKCHMPNRFAKLIVFCRNLEHIAQCREDMHRWLGPGKKIREYVCRSDEKAADIELNAFAGDNERNAIRLLYCVDMLNEGIHIKDVDGVVMLRPTISPIVYLQQIGRCLACSSDGSTSPVIFDLVNNYESARVEESGQRVFNIEFSHHPSSGKGKNTPIPFYMSGVPTQFEAILEKFDHLFTRAGRWDFCYSILQEFYHEYGQYPHSRTCYRGIKIGRWLSEQILYIQHNSLSAARKERLEMLPGWSTFLIERQPTRRTFDDYYKELLVYFEREGHIDIPQSYINPSTGCKLGLYLTRLRNIRKKTDRGHLSQDQINRLNALGMKWVKREHPYRDFDYYYQQLIKFYRREGHIKVPTRFIDPDTGCHLGNFINCVRQAKRGTGHDIVLTDRQIEMLNDLGMVWQVQASPLPFDTYYEELLRYYRREGHIRVPGNYIVPENGCKLGKFIQRMRAIRAGTASSGFITQEQIAKLDAMGMVWNASNSKKNLEERSCRNGYFHLVDSGGDRTQQADCGDQQNTG
ncbi:Helicase associated domain protein [Dysosmobacter welbionis]|jgi:superfamily II DNA or RNA helicase|uniref:Helicase associated domain protein n=1 Tax=Dysosmobacter welbionis TaxID=2093857 RepID=UPI0006C0B706|nr:Predicted HKD family nuclease [Flavonifractor plautii]